MNLSQDTLRSCAVQSQEKNTMHTELKETTGKIVRIKNGKEWKTFSEMVTSNLISEEIQQPDEIKPKPVSFYSYFFTSHNFWSNYYFLFINFQLSLV